MTRPLPFSLAFALAAVIMAGASHPSAAGDPVRPAPRYRLSDCHLHLVDFLQRTDGAAAAVKAMDRAGVEDTMLCGMPFVKKWEQHAPARPDYYLDDDGRCYWYSATDVLVARAVQALPRRDQRRIHPFICGFNGTDKNAVDHVKRMLEWYPGFWEGIGEVMGRHDDLTALAYGEPGQANSNALDPVYALAAKYDLPVSVHNNISSVNKRDPIYLSEIEQAVARHSQTRFIWCHAGISRRVTVPTLTAELRRMVEKYPNLWIDLSWVLYEDYIYKLDARTGARSLDPAWIRLLEDHPTRFMIGSDKVGRFAAYGEEIQKYYPLLDALRQETARRVARENFLAVLPRKPASLDPGDEAR